MGRKTAAMNDLAIEGCTIRVVVEGDASRPTLVLAHMLGADLSLWDWLMPAFLEHFRVVRYDARGHGGSGLGAAPVTVERLGRDVVAVLDTLSVERAHFCGMSMGGAIGLWLLAHAPERFDRAVIADSAARLGGPDVWNPRIAAALSEGMEQAVPSTIERWFSPEYVEEAPAKVDAVRKLILATPPEGYAACCGALRDMDLRETARSITHPVLIVRGSDDPSVPEEDIALLVEAIDNSTSSELDARHCSAVEAEAEFAAAVIKFLTARSVPRRTGARRRTMAGSAETRTAKAGSATRRRGGRDADAARRPVAKTTPVSGKAVAKASATRKVAARAALKSPEPAASHRRAAKTRPAVRSISGGTGATRAGASATRAAPSAPKARSGAKPTPVQPPPAKSRSATPSTTKSGTTGPSGTKSAARARERARPVAASSKSGSPRHAPQAARTATAPAKPKPTAAALKAALTKARGERRPLKVKTSAKAVPGDPTSSNSPSAKAASIQPSPARSLPAKAPPKKVASPKSAAAKAAPTKAVSATATRSQVPVPLTEKRRVATAGTTAEAPATSASTKRRSVPPGAKERRSTGRSRS